MFRVKGIEAEPVGERPCRRHGYWHKNDMAKADDAEDDQAVQ